MTRVGRWIKRALLLALLAFVALQSWYLLHIFYWRYADPHMTSFMEIRIEEMHESDPRAFIRQTWVPYERISLQAKASASSPRSWACGPAAWNAIING